MVLGVDLFVMTTSIKETLARLLDAIRKANLSNNNA